MNIGTAVITPETATNNAPAVTGQQESDFYRRSASEYNLRQHAQDLGWLGKFFGSNTAAPIYTAAVISILLTVALIGTIFVGASAEISEARTILGGILGTVLGYLFGASTSKR